MLSKFSIYAYMLELLLLDWAKLNTNPVHLHVFLFPLMTHAWDTRCLYKNQFISNVLDNLKFKKLKNYTERANERLTTNA